jgi:hypothetical protein
MEWRIIIVRLALCFSSTEQYRQPAENCEMIQKDEWKRIALEGEAAADATFRSICEIHDENAIKGEIYTAAYVQRLFKRGDVIGRSNEGK